MGVYSENAVNFVAGLTKLQKRAKIIFCIILKFIVALDFDTLSWWYTRM